MKTLRLAVKREYFEQIKSGEKLEEYRITNKYWIKRFYKTELYNNFETLFKYNIFNTYDLNNMILKDYDTLVITLGYPKADDKEKILTFKYNGFKIKEITHKHFGNIPVNVFAIDLSERIKQ